MRNKLQMHLINMPFVTKPVYRFCNVTKKIRPIFTTVYFINNGHKKHRRIWYVNYFKKREIQNRKKLEKKKKRIARKTYNFLLKYKKKNKEVHKWYYNKDILHKKKSQMLNFQNKLATQSHYKNLYKLSIESHIAQRTKKNNRIKRQR